MNEASYASLSFMDPYKPSSGLGHILPVYSLGRRIHEHCADVLCIVIDWLLLPARCVRRVIRVIQSGARVWLGVSEGSDCVNECCDKSR